MLSKLFSFSRREKTAAKVPSGSRVYAVGDIHGRADLLEILHALVLEDARKHPAGRRVIVYLGDYVDRGLHTREVIDMLLAPPLDGFERVCLKGNHEAMMLDFLGDAAAGPGWMELGGKATLLSYGVGVEGGFTAAKGMKQAQSQLREKLPQAHLALLDALPLTHVEGDYLFVHAGVRPGLAIEKQVEQDLIWIREPFLSSTADHGKIVVHGHTIAGSRPSVSQRRIGIDTAAYATGVLSCLVLSGEERGFVVARR
ncbi:MAG: metallophosphoesterase family protein [Alphaproteobacteria bacterium]